MSQVIKLFLSITNHICTEENSRQQIGIWCVLLFILCIFLCNLCVILSFFVCLCFCMFVFVDHLQHYLVEPVGKKSARGFPLSHYSAGRQIAVEGTFRVCKIKPKQRFGSIFFLTNLYQSFIIYIIILIKNKIKTKHKTWIINRDWSAKFANGPNIKISIMQKV